MKTIIDINNKTIKNVEITEEEKTQLINENINSNKIIKIAELKAELEELTKDFAQVNAGLKIDNIEEKKVEFQTKLNKIRVLLGKEPRSIKK